MALLLFYLLNIICTKLYLALGFRMSYHMPHHTLQLKIIDIVYDCLQNWSNTKFNITIEAEKHPHDSLIFIKLWHVGETQNFFKAGMKINPSSFEDLDVLESFLNFLNCLWTLSTCQTTQYNYGTRYLFYYINMKIFLKSL